ncbi:MAG: phospho-sugar mutase, partial [Clostridiales bacterium]|nr:phospho-sugar mutase [Clostridiales bacterium]
MESVTISQEYKRWIHKATVDQDIVNELKNMGEVEIEDAFYRDLTFGTGGLRGVIGAGTNRMNIYTVAKASQGLSDYVKKNFPEDERKIAVSFDSRIKSDLFAQVASGVFAANGIQVSIYKELMPTPCLSYAVRTLGCVAGIMVTASHNPSKYNGYKVYGADGCQITTEAAADILAEIEKLDIFDDVNNETFEQGIEEGKIFYISDDVYTSFVEEVKKQSVLYGDEINKDVSIVYSPLNGTGLKPVLRTLKESGYTNITVVKEQEKPDGHFPTCPYPNPEIKEAMALGMEYAAKCNADLLLATDPDCDRVGIAVKNDAGEYVLLSGNETGMLLLDYICSQRIKHGKMPDDPVLVKTIVTIDMADRIAAKYGVRTVNVLTGFKFIGEQIGFLEKQGKEDSYVFGFEESYGYLSGGYVRDKDAVDGAFLICEMFTYYKKRGISLLDKLNELYEEFGYCLNTLHSFTFEGSAGIEKMQKIMAKFHEGVDEIGPKKVLTTLDYSKGLDRLPKSDVLKYLLDDNCSVVVRPSGTEPKLKTYISISAKDKETATEIEQKVVEALKVYFPVLNTFGIEKEQNSLIF